VGKCQRVLANYKSLLKKIELQFWHLKEQRILNSKCLNQQAS
jgi:hypothetical protein